MTIYEKASIRASILDSVSRSMQWDVSNQKERIERYVNLNKENNSNDYDPEIEDAQFRLSVFESVEKALEKLL